MFKRLYVRGLIISLLIIFVRSIFIWQKMTMENHIKEIILSILILHLYLIFGYGLMMMNRIIYSEAWAEFRMSILWFMMFIYVFSIGYWFISQISDPNIPFHLFSGFCMLIIGASYENQTHEETKRELEVVDPLPDDPFEKELNHGKSNIKDDNNGLSS